MTTAGKAMKKQGGHPEQKKAKNMPIFFSRPFGRPGFRRSGSESLRLGMSRFRSDG